MKKLLIPIVVLLAFSVLVTSVSAPVSEYYMARFHGSASGICLVFEEEPGPDPIALGKGRFHIRGLALVREDADYYWANEADPNTRIWTRRVRMRVSWNNEKLMVHMWPSGAVWGMFYDEENWFYIANMTFSGYYIEDSTLQHVSGSAQVLFAKIGPEEVLAAIVVLYIGPDIFYSFGWVSEGPPEYVARGFSHRVTVWPIPWYLPPP